MSGEEGKGDRGGSEILSDEIGKHLDCLLWTCFI